MNATEPTAAQEIVTGAAELALLAGVLRLAEDLARRRLDNHGAACDCPHCTLMGRQEHEVHAELAGVAWQLGKLAQAVEMMTTDVIAPASDLSFGESLLELAELSELVDAAIGGDYGPALERERANIERQMAAIRADDAEMNPAR